MATKIVEWYVRDANGLLQGPWSKDVCFEDVDSGEGGVEVVRREIVDTVVTR